MTVLVAITRKDSAVALARLGFQWARALEQRLVVLCLEEGPDDGPSGAMAPVAEPPEDLPESAGEICRALARRGMPRELAEGEAATDEPVPAREHPLADPEVEVRWRSTRHRRRAVLELVAELDVELLLAAKTRERDDGSPVSLARKLFTSAPCHTVLVRLAEGEHPGYRRLLVPTAGGPHAGVALRLGERLARAEGGEMVALYVQKDVDDLAAAVGRRILDRSLRRAGVVDSPVVRPLVILGQDHEAVIAEMAEKDFDLLLLGESNAGTLRRKLFGTVPDRLLAATSGLSLAVVRRRWRLFHRLRHHLGRWLALSVPQMTRDDRIALFEKLQSGSEWNFDFWMLIVLSTGIASLGLLQSSTAVVIGAMLVAPLMTPILGAGLALVQGNLPLLRSASNSIVRGFLWALAIGAVTAYFFPVPELTPELAARGRPGLPDMGVAFLSGLAAAYCLSRPGLLAALPGVAIAAALVPPIATTGVSLSLGEMANGLGAAVLFATNVVAIILGAVVSLYAGGVRGRSGASSRQRWVRWFLLALLAGAVLLGILVARPL